MPDWLGSLIQDNQLVQGGLVLSLLSAVVVWARNLPALIWRGARRTFVVDIEVVDSDELFSWISRWFSAQDFTTKWNYLSAISYWNAEEHKRLVGFSPGSGSNLFRYRGAWVRVSFHRERAESGGWNEQFTFYCLKMHKPQLLELFNDCRKLSLDERLHIFSPTSYGEWGSTQQRAPRPISTIVASAGVVDLVVGSCRDFLERKQRYASLGVPHRYGMLFYGPPGTGKTSLVTALATELELDIYNLSLQDCKDAKMSSLFAAVPPRSIVLIEDLDRQMEHLGTKDGPTLAGLLNAIDGVQSSDSRVLIITTNNRDTLPDVLLRPGRVDRLVHLDLPGVAEIEHMAGMFGVNGSRLDGLRKLAGTASTADIQRELLIAGSIENEES